MKTEGKICEPYVRSGLAQEQREAIFLLSIGTFLEYFDLMLYVHMAVLLNELFFPQNNPLIAQLLGVFTFCSTFVLRPVGGFIIGRIGDSIGRKNTVIITTFIMAICCLIIANTPTYTEIGIAASTVIIICRSLQGFTSMGEKVGAMLYLAETMKQPHKYIYCWIIQIQSEFGGTFALIVASLSITYAFNWRIAFWVGAVIAIIGLIARTRLRETPEFVSYKLRLKKQIEANKQNTKILENSHVYKEKIDIKVALSYFTVRFLGPACFYIIYIYTATFMKESLGLSSEEIINQNLKVSLLVVLGLIGTMLFVKKYHPIKIVKINIILFIICLPFIPYCLNNVTNLFVLMCLQFIMFSPAFSIPGIELACYKHFPIAKRFTALATIFGIASALSYTIVSFSLIPLASYIGHYSLFIIYIPILVCYILAVNYVKKLEQKKGYYDDYPNEDKLENTEIALDEQNYKYDLRNG